MKAMDEFGSVLALTTVILGLCAGVDELFSSNEAGSARTASTYPEYGADR